MVSRKRKPNFPDRKISETFLQFSEPLLTPLGPSATKEQMNQVLQIAFTVWNAVVYESVNSDTQYLQMARDLTKGQPEIEGLINQLIQRKRQLFGDDHRLVGEFKLTLKNGELNLRVEARDPTTKV